MAIWDEIKLESEARRKTAWFSAFCALVNKNSNSNETGYMFGEKKVEMEKQKNLNGNLALVFSLLLSCSR